MHTQVRMSTHTHTHSWVISSMGPRVSGETTFTATFFTYTALCMKPLDDTRIDLKIAVGNREQSKKEHSVYS